jgi:hypothetical protein
MKRFLLINRGQGRALINQTNALFGPVAAIDVGRPPHVPPGLSRTTGRVGYRVSIEVDKIILFMNEEDWAVARVALPAWDAAVTEIPPTGQDTPGNPADPLP